MRQQAALVAVAAALGLSACGDDESSAPSGPDPATLAPADAALYAEGLVRPEDERAEEIESVLGSLLGDEDPGATIIDEIEQGLSEEGTDLSYAEDVEPWLGERAGIFFSDFQREANGAAIVSSTDEEEAQAALDRLAEQEGVASEEAYEDVAYTVTDEDTALGIVDGFAVVGSEPGFEAVVDASRGDPLAESAEFEEVTADARADGVITTYADPQTVLEELVAAGEITAQQRAAVVESAAGRLESPVVFSAGAESAGLYLELSTAADSAGATESGLLERLPADPSIAFAFADLGEKLAPALAGASLADLDHLEGTGIDPVATTESVGDVAGYFTGTSILGLGGALMVEIADERVATDLLDRLRARFSGDPSVTVQPGDDEGEAFSVSPSGIPIEFPFVFRDGLVAAGLGEGSVEQVFAPESSLADSDAETAATSALGDGFELSALVDFEPLLELLHALPGASDDPDLQAALPYLERSDLLAAGTRETDGRAVSRVALELDQETE